MPSLIPIRIAAIREFAAQRPDGYLEDCLTRGKIEGEFLLLEETALAELRIKYAPQGLGDRIARFAKPLARKLDGLLGTELAYCPGCAARQAWLNEHFPKV